MFDDLFLIKRFIKANCIDNKILFQVLKKVKSLTKVFFKELEHIKKLKDNIYELIKNTKIISKRINISLKKIIVLHIAKYATANKITGL